MKGISKKKKKKKIATNQKRKTLSYSRVSSVPFHPSLSQRFPNGFLDLGTLTAESYKTLIQIVPVVLRQLEEDIKDKEVIETFEIFADLEKDLQNPSFSESNLQVIDQKVHRYFSIPLSISEARNLTPIHFKLSRQVGDFQDGLSLKAQFSQTS